MNTHNGVIPRDDWLTPEERRAILTYYDTHAPEGYRRMTFMMLDANVVAVSPATVYRVRKAAGVLDRWNRTPSKKGTGFVQPLGPHEHWHIDISYVNLAGTFYYLCSILDGATRFLLHWELRERMTTADVEVVLQPACEQYPNEHPCIISDNGPQFIARDFKEFIRLAGLTHVRTAPYYPQSNGKLERYHQTLKARTIRPKASGSRAPAAAAASRATAVRRARRRSTLGARARTRHTPAALWLSFWSSGGSSRGRPGSRRALG